MPGMAKVRWWAKNRLSSTIKGNRNAATCATEFLITEIAVSYSPRLAIRMPVKFSAALPAIATITRPAKALEMFSWSIAGVSASMNHAEMNAAMTPATAIIATQAASDSRGARWWVVGWSSLRRYGTTHAT